MLMLNVGIVLISSIIIIFMFCFGLFRVLSGCCLVVMYLGGGMSFKMMYLYVVVDVVLLCFIKPILGNLYGPGVIP